MVTEELQNTLGQYVRPAMVYVIPNFHNPTGWTTPEEGRRRVIDLVLRQNLVQTEQILLVEDDSYGLTRFEGEALPALFDLSGGRTVYSSSFSVTVAPGLRVGFFILPDELAGQLTDVAASTVHHPRAARTGDRPRVHQPRQLRAAPDAAARRLEAPPGRDARCAREAFRGCDLVAAGGRPLRLARASGLSGRPRGAEARAGSHRCGRDAIRRGVERASSFVRVCAAGRDRSRGRTNRQRRCNVVHTSSHSAL